MEKYADMWSLMAYDDYAGGWNNATGYQVILFHSADDPG
jgi:GH18 family chitinase